MPLHEPCETRNDVTTELGCVAFITDTAGQILLVRWNTGLQPNHWGLPGGSVKGMTPATLSLVNEIHRVLGVLIWPHRIVAVCDEIDQALNAHRVSIAYSAAIVSGKPFINDCVTVEEFGWFTPSALPQPLTRPTIDVLRASGKCMRTS